MQFLKIANIYQKSPLYSFSHSILFCGQLYEMSPNLYILLKRVIVHAVVKMTAFFPRLASQPHYINIYTPVDRHMHVHIEVYNPIVFM